MLGQLEKMWSHVERAKVKAHLPGSKIRVQVCFDRDIPTLKIFDHIGQIELNKADINILTKFLSNESGFLE